MNDTPGRGGRDFDQPNIEKKDDWDDWGKDDHVKGVRDDDDDDRGRRTQ